MSSDCLEEGLYQAIIAVKFITKITREAFVRGAFLLAA